MDFGNSPTYVFELWSSNGVRVADISRHIHNRTYTIERNEAEQLTFDIDLYDWETFCTSLGADPAVILTPYAMDVKVIRNGIYLFGTQIVAAVINIGTDYTMNQGAMDGGSTSFNPTISVTCTGYLNLFKDRYVTAIYSGAERCYVAGDLITQAQSVTNGGVGVVLAAGQYSTGTTDGTRTYTRDNVKTSLQDLTQLVDGRFDFSFDYLKNFYTWSQIGSKRTDIQFTYGGPSSNIIGLYLEKSAANLYNEIIGLGSGFGSDQLISTQDDTASQLNYYLRQDIKQYNTVTVQSTLDGDAQADLALEKDLLAIPQITISGKELENTSFLSVGDRIPLAFVGHPYLSALTGIYRIEKMVVDLDDNDFEQEIDLYFDNYAVGSN